MPGKEVDRDAAADAAGHRDAARGPGPAWANELAAGRVWQPDPHVAEQQDGQQADRQTGAGRLDPRVDQGADRQAGVEWECCWPGCVAVGRWAHQGEPAADAEEVFQERRWVAEPRAVVAAKLAWT